LAKDFKTMESKGLPRTTGGDGSSLERAIVLPDAKKETVGVAAEYAVLRMFFPGWRKVTQHLTTGPDHRPYDLIVLEKDGKQRDVYFDITSFFGNME
jgi:hypothetical protein